MACGVEVKGSLPVTASTCSGSIITGLVGAKEREREREREGHIYTHTHLLKGHSVFTRLKRHSNDRVQQPTSHGCTEDIGDRVNNAKFLFVCLLELIVCACYE